MSCHPWCKDIDRDERVRADEDGRIWKHPTLTQCIEKVFRTSKESKSSG